MSTSSLDVLPGELRVLVYGFVSDTRDINTTDQRLQMPGIGFSGLRSEYLAVFFGACHITVGIATFADRMLTQRFLRAWGDVAIGNARQFTISAAGACRDGLWTDLQFALGRRTVRVENRVNAAYVRVGKVQVAFIALIESRRYNRIVVRGMANAINDILASHGPDAPARISLEELKSVVGLLDYYHGLRSYGLHGGGRLTTSASARLLSSGSWLSELVSSPGYQTLACRRYRWRWHGQGGREDGGLRHGRR